MRDGILALLDALIGEHGRHGQLEIRDGRVSFIRGRLSVPLAALEIEVVESHGQAAHELVHTATGERLVMPHSSPHYFVPVEMVQGLASAPIATCADGRSVIDPPTGRPMVMDHALTRRLSRAQAVAALAHAPGGQRGVMLTATRMPRARARGAGRPRAVSRASGRGGDSGDSDGSGSSEGDGEPPPPPAPLLFVLDPRFGRINRALARFLRRGGRA